LRPVSCSAQRHCSTVPCTARHTVALQLHCTALRTRHAECSAALLWTLHCSAAPSPTARRTAVAQRPYAAECRSDYR
jgi:hypothetical protein